MAMESLEKWSANVLDAIDDQTSALFIILKKTMIFYNSFILIAILNMEKYHVVFS